jgi:tripartite ATP-independent transporter DctM subunit
MGALILIGSFLLMVVAGLPIAFALGVSSLLCAAYLDLPLLIVLQKMSDGMDNFSLMAIPFFVLAGAIMAEGGMARRLVSFANLLVGRVRGGLSLVDILASMFFGGISGSSVADTSSVGSILIPMMNEKGYDKDFSVNVTVTASTQGIIIPPSHNAIIYSLAAGGTVSIAKLFMAGFIPGVLVGLSLMITALIISYRRGYPREEKITLRQAAIITRDALLGLVNAVIIVGGVLSGFFTATESSAIAVVYAFVITFFVYRDIRLKEFPGILVRSVKTIAIVMLLIGTSSAFGWLIAYLRIPEAVTNFFFTISQNKIIVMVLINIMLLLLGTIMDMAPLILIVTPILLPVVTAIGFSPIHFGIILMLNLSIGLCTPPVGSTLFVGCAIGKISIEEAMKSIWMFYIAMIIVLVLVTYIPVLSMWLPGFIK